ncbi:MAG: TetR/AcrR family transcriptional regulator [Solirubrobacterales bacterium]|nr:TetR/AcrR family transcriptional regulator [Solirubrobacterales bacterium]
MSEVAAPVGKRERTKAANRAAILRAGTEVFAELGYGAASVRDIVRRTDLAAGTFYNYFPDKESVLREIMDDVAEQIRSRARAARLHSTTLEGFIADGFRAYYELLAADRHLFELLRRNHGTIRAMFDEPAIFAGYEELQEDLLAAVASGALPAVDVDYMAGAMVGAGFEIAVLMLERDPPDVEGAVHFVTSLFIGGLERLREVPVRTGTSDAPGL